MGEMLAAVGAIVNQMMTALGMNSTFLTGEAGLSDESIVSGIIAATVGPVLDNLGDLMNGMAAVVNDFLALLGA